MEDILTTQEFEEKIGEDLKALRLQKNVDRKTLSLLAGVSMNALRHLETGKGATLKTLIRVVRALERQDWLFGIAPKVTINPLHMKRDHQTRQRASRRKQNV